MVLILQILFERSKNEKFGSDFEDKINKVKKKIPNVSDLVKIYPLTASENKILDVSRLATKSALTAVENKLPDVSSLVKNQILILRLLK